MGGYEKKAQPLKENGMEVSSLKNLESKELIKTITSIFKNLSLSQLLITMTMAAPLFVVLLWKRVRCFIFPVQIG